MNTLPSLGLPVTPISKFQTSSAYLSIQSRVTSIVMVFVKIPCTIIVCNAAKSCSKRRKPNGRSSVMTAAEQLGGQLILTESIEKKSSAPACTAGRSLKPMRARRKNTARQTAISKIDSRATHRKHKGMTAVQHSAEKNIRLCLMVVSALHVHGYMTAKDTL